MKLQNIIWSQKNIWIKTIDSRQRTTEIIDFIDLRINSVTSPDQKIRTSKHHLIREKNLDQEYCFSTTNGPKEYRLSRFPKIHSKSGKYHLFESWAYGSQWAVQIPGNRLMFLQGMMDKIWLKLHCNKHGFRIFLNDPVEPQVPLFPNIAYQFCLITQVLQRSTSVCRALLRWHTQSMDLRMML